MERKVKSYSKLHTMPCGAITATGWIREQLERNKSGMGGHLDELEPYMFKYPYTTRETDSAWGHVQAGWGAEISGNYWYGVIALAFALDDNDLKEKAATWVNATLDMQDDDGYMGTYTETDNKNDDFNGAGTACGMRALLLYFEATGREDILEAVHRCMLWFCENWDKDQKTTYSGSIIEEPMLTCYYYTGDEKLLRFCVDYEEFLCSHDLFLNSKNAMADKKLHYNSTHTCNYTPCVRRLMRMYAATGDSTYLEASVNGMEKLRAKAVHSTGGPVCKAEYLSPVSFAAESEYCAFTYTNEAYAVMGTVTGQARYGDYMEEIVYNAAEGARKKDEKAIAYMSSPNQIFATEMSSNYSTTFGMYAPAHPVSCCPANSVAVIPELVKDMAITDDEDNLYIQVYGPCIIHHNNVTIREETMYPFRGDIQFHFDVAKEKTFSFYVKIPNWCQQYTVMVNGIEVTEKADEHQYLPINRTWHNGDVVSVNLERNPVVVRVDDSDAGKKYPLTVRYGALVFALPIEENWVDKGNGHAHTPLPEGWSWYNVEPVIHSGNHDPYEIMGYRKHDITWNVAFDEDAVKDSITVLEKDTDDYVWENPPIEIMLDAYKAPYSYPPYPCRTTEIYEEKLLVTNKLRLTLVPYGCTALRITYFPRADV